MVFALINSFTNIPIDLYNDRKNTIIKWENYLDLVGNQRTFFHVP